MNYFNDQNNCLFCKLILEQKNIKLLYNTKKIITILDAFPISKGHTLIITKKHFPNIYSLPWDIYNETFIHIKATMDLIKKVYKTDQFNVLNNMGYQAKQRIFHFHWHIIPKFTEDDGLITSPNYQKNLEIDKIHKELLQNIKDPNLMN